MPTPTCLGQDHRTDHDLIAMQKPHAFMENYASFCDPGTPSAANISAERDSVTTILIHMLQQKMLHVGL